MMEHATDILINSQVMSAGVVVGRNKNILPGSCFKLTMERVDWLMDMGHN